MKMYKQCMMGLVVAGMIGFTGCKDDVKENTPNLEDQFTNARDNYNDLLLDPSISAYITMYEPIYGRVESIEEVQYNNATWDNTNDEVKAGNPSYKTYTEYNTVGFKTLEEFFQVISTGNPPVQKFRKNSTIEYTLDSRNRQIESIQKAIVYESSTSLEVHEVYPTYRYVTTYHDVDKEATVLEYFWDRNTDEYVLQSKTVYKLMSNGRIDWNSYTTYLKNDEADNENVDDNGDEWNRPRYSNEIVTERDSHRNWTLFYSLENYYNNDGDEIDYRYVYNYKTRVFKYHN